MRTSKKWKLPRNGTLQEIESSWSLNNLKNQLGNNWISYIAQENSSWGELAYLVNANAIEISEPPYTIL